MRYRSPIEKVPSILTSCKNQFVNSIGRATFQFCVLVQPLVYGFLLGMMYLERSDVDFTVYVLFGSGIVTFWSTICFSSASDIQRERWYGTLENLFVCPAGFETAVLGKIIGNTLWGLISMAISATFVVLVFQRTIVIAHWGLLGLGFLLMTVSFIAIAFMMAGLFTLSRSARILMNVLEHPIYILCGIVFPVEILPHGVQWFSYLLSPTWAVKVLRLSVTGGSGGDIQTAILGLLVTTALYWVAAWRSFRVIDRKARVEASLGVY